MGGKGSGGLRVGAGRKSKDKAGQWLGGNAGKRGGAKAKPEATSVELIAAPVGMPEAEAAVWNELGPHACAQRTLVPSTASAFALLCKAVVIERALGVDPAHRGHASHRGMMQRVEAGMSRFRLSPMGKELAPAGPAPVDPFDKFDETVN